MSKQYNIAIVGVTGVVGQKILELLETLEIPINELRCFASPRSEGQKILFKGRTQKVKSLRDDSFINIDVAFFSAGGAVSKRYVPKAVAAGAVCIDNTSVFRLNEHVPLVIPEVNFTDIKAHSKIIANPNCSTIQLATVLAPLQRTFGLKKIIVSTYQAVSGAGRSAISELAVQSQNDLDASCNFNTLPVKTGNKHYQIAYNCLPQIDHFHANGYTLEELKIINETKKILHDDNLKISATCVRVPVFTSHAESVYIELEKEAVTTSQIREYLEAARGITVQDNLDEQYYPQPITAAGHKDIFVGRIRPDLDSENGFNLWIVADNLLKGAAWNSMQIFEHLIINNLI